jgi:hypothetical protein
MGPMVLSETKIQLSRVVIAQRATLWLTCRPGGRGRRVAGQQREGREGGRDGLSCRAAELRESSSPRAGRTSKSGAMEPRRRVGMVMDAFGSEGARAGSARRCRERLRVGREGKIDGSARARRRRGRPETARLPPSMVRRWCHRQGQATSRSSPSTTSSSDRGGGSGCKRAPTALFDYADGQHVPAQFSPACR